MIWMEFERNYDFTDADLAMGTERTLLKMLVGWEVGVTFVQDGRPVETYGFIQAVDGGWLRLTDVWSPGTTRTIGIADITNMTLTW